MLCKKCGKENDGDAKFCLFCGNNLSSSNLNTKLSFGEKIKHFFVVGIGLAAVIGAFIIFISSYNFFLNVISGPRAITAETLEQEMVSGNIKDINVILSLPYGEVYQSGYTGITKTVNQDTNQVESQTTDSEYYITKLGQHLLVLEGTPGQMPAGDFRGAVIPLRSDLQQQMVSDFSNDADLQNLTSSILPYTVTNKGMTAVDSFGLIILGLILLIFGASILFKTLGDRAKN